MSQFQALAISGAASIAAATQTSADQGSPINSRWLSALVLTFDVTVLTGTAPTLQCILEAKDSISGKYVSFGTFTAISATGTYTYAIGLGVGAAGDGITTTKSYPAPNFWRVRVVGGGTAITNATYTVGAETLVENG